MQYVNQRRIQSGLGSVVTSGLAAEELRREDSGDVTPSNIGNGATISETGFSILSDTGIITTTCPILSNPFGVTSPVMDEDQFGTDMPMGHRKRSSLHTVWSNSLTSPGPLVQYHTNPQTQVMRRLSLRCAHSTGSNSSGSTSGLGSSLSTTSFIVVDDNSVESSRRSSQNTCSSDVGDVFRPAAQSTVGHLSTTDEVFLSSWTGTTNFGLSTAGGGSAPRPLLGSEPVFTSTRHSSSGPRCIDPRGEIAQNLIEHFSTLGLDSPGSAGINSLYFPEHNTQLPCEIGSTTHVTPGWGRRHHSTSCVAINKGTGPSFWPSDPESGCRSRMGDNSDMPGRKVVSRKGNIFKPRQDFTVFQTLPAHKRNAYFIQMDDDSCTGNEDTRAFLLAQLTNHRISEVACLACHQTLVVYDHFPVIDGIFFISPVCHRSSSPNGRRSVSGLRVTWHTNGVPTGTHPSKISGANVDPEEVSQEQVHKLLGSGLMVVPPPGCLGPRQQVAGSHTGPEGNVATQHHPQWHQSYQQQHTSTTGRHGGGGRQERYLHALCLDCLHRGIPVTRDDTAMMTSTETTERIGGIYCRSCLRPWSG
ncbi:hypothetical protein FBUS_09522 [Fasciolopsis buskii]|uniref:Headcase middle domain-containing protein n=1 Tax=Fasciolopsis buskii TaxID=27845 RepID=A0A8E0S0V4_9TREM|nr:hypothetical protein FBUS_09522 [Fasciolopsis buski]